MMVLFVISLVFSSSRRRFPFYNFQVLSGLSTRTSIPSLRYLSKPQIGNIFAAYANLSSIFLQSIGHDPFEEAVEEDGD